MSHDHRDHDHYTRPLEGLALEGHIAITHSNESLHGVATISRMLKNIGLFCKRALQKRPVFCKETCIFKHPTNRSHPIMEWIWNAEMHTLIHCIHTYIDMRTSLHTGYMYEHVYIRVLLLNPYARYFNHLYEWRVTEWRRRPIHIRIRTHTRTPDGPQGLYNDPSEWRILMESFSFSIYIYQRHCTHVDWQVYKFCVGAKVSESAARARGLYIAHSNVSYRALVIIELHEVCTMTHSIPLH